MSKARDRAEPHADVCRFAPDRINSLNTDLVNRDNRVEKEKIKQELNTALAELERLKKEIDATDEGDRGD